MDLVDMHVGRPVTRGALSLFPIWSGTAVTSPGYAVHAAEVSVAERPDTPSVAELEVTNSGSKPALVLEGELLEGGWQHRVTTQSALVAAKAQVVLPVQCVEQGRWAGGGGHARRGRHAPVVVRAAQGQGAVWERVSRYEDRHGGTDTHSLLAATDRVEQTAAALVEGLAPLPFQTGVLIGIAGQPVSLEVFDSPRTLAQVWGGLLHAAAVDAVSAAAVATPGRRARRFVARVAAVSVTPEPGPGLGASGRARSSYVVMSVLVWRGRAVHTVAINPGHDLVAA
ncbi:DUF6569 family protein [Amycolatopsis sp. NPDC051128]|uniref:ARPP-1 family domain-containing protein n=1 Tax=Amycolatopsis sp. NPDC051128 TaxID=3155412 RepID=UPI00343A2A24